MKTLLIAALSLSALALPAQADVLSFQGGDGGSYSTSNDTFIQKQVPNQNNGTYQYLQFDFDPTTSQEGLVRFPDIFGPNTGQIPPGSTINSCTLTLIFTAASTSTHTVHQVFTGWDANTATWNNFGTSPGGVSGTDYAAAAAATFVPSPVGAHTFDITSVCQAWCDGATNEGVIILDTTTSGSQCYSDNSASVADHPLLTVDFTPSTVADEASSWSNVKALFR